MVSTDLTIAAGAEPGIKAMERAWFLAFSGD